MANHFLQKQATSSSSQPKRIDLKAMALLCKYNDPNNVRELQNAVERACALCDDDLIVATDLPPEIVDFGKDEVGRRSKNPVPLGQSLDEFIRQQGRKYL